MVGWNALTPTPDARHDAFQCRLMWVRGGFSVRFRAWSAPAIATARLRIPNPVKVA